MPHTTTAPLAVVLAADPGPSSCLDCGPTPATDGYCSIACGCDADARGELDPAVHVTRRTGGYVRCYCGEVYDRHPGDHLADVADCGCGAADEA